MDDLLSEFLEETNESLDVVDVELVKFEQDPNNAEILDNIFRLVHTIKGTCGFLGLPRLGSLAHAAETLMGKYREGAPVTGDGVSLILNTIDRLKEILADLEQSGAEPDGTDDDLIDALDAMSADSQQDDAGGEAAPEQATDAEPETETLQVLERELKPGEVSLEELERAFQDTPGPEATSGSEAASAPVPAEQVVAAAQAEQKTAAPEQAPAAKKATPPKTGAVPGNAAASEKPTKADGPVKTQSIRVNVETLEHLMTMVSELVLTRNQLLEIVRRHEDSEFKVPLQRLSNVTAELQDGVMQTRMQPIGNAWQKLPRVVRDLSNELGKKIELEMNGADTELDRQVLDVIKDPLTHMVRNSADHGLEDTEDRLQLGKPEAGKVTLSAYHEGGQIIIEISDDGRGLDAEKIKAKAIASKLVTEEEVARMSENQVHKLIFHPGLSTAKNVTNVSGRGVGMDVVRTNIELIGGTVDLKSFPGRGTSFIIKIPLTLAIVSALIVEAAGQRFAIPQLSVVELVRTHKDSEHRVEMINDTPVLRLRNSLLPVIHLNNLLKLNNIHTADEDDMAEEGDITTRSVFVVVTQVGSQTFGIVVDSVFHTEEIVVKPMSSMLRDITMFSGNTILGDGSVIMIIDPNGIAQSVVDESTGSSESIDKDTKTYDNSVDQVTTFLIFRAGSPEPKAVPLSLVTRLEEIETENVEYSNGRYLVQYRGQLMPLVSFEGLECDFSGDNRRQPVLVFSDENHSMGLVVDEIIDIIEDKLKIEIASDRPDLIGSAVIKSKATEVIDVSHYLVQVFDDWLLARDRKTSTIKRDLHLLLVDDSPFFRNMLAPLLSATGYKVTLASSAEEALEIKDQGGHFDLIVSDIEMPGMNGIEFAHALRGDEDWGNTPIVALSSHTEPHIIEKSRAAGFHDYVGKFDREGLIETLRECKAQTGVAA